MKKMFRKIYLDNKTILALFLIASNSAIILSFTSLARVSPNQFYGVFSLTKKEFVNILQPLTWVVPMGIIFGWIQDIFSVRAVLAVNTFLCGCLTFYIALNPPSSLNAILFTFLCLELLQGIFYFSSVIKGVSRLASPFKQATTMGIVEVIRGFTVIFIRTIAFFIFVLIGKTVLAMKIAMLFTSCLTIISACLIWTAFPKEQNLDTDCKENKTKIAFLGLVKAIKTPYLWLIGFCVSCAYTIYVAMTTYFVHYLDALYKLPFEYHVLFGILIIYIMRYLAALFAALIADSKFKSSAYFMQMCYLVLIVLFLVMIFLPKVESLMPLATIFIFAISLVSLSISAIYYAPIGEMSKYKSITAADVSISQFIGFLPGIYAYYLFNSLLEKWGLIDGYRIIFILLLTVSVLGAVGMTFIAKKIDRVRIENIENKI